MSITVVVSFEVEDFDKFKSVFDTGRTARSEAGLEADAYKNIDAPNNVWIVGTVTSREAFAAFFADPASQERLKKAGAISSPNITLLET